MSGCLKNDATIAADGSVLKEMYRTNVVTIGTGVAFKNN